MRRTLRLFRETAHAALQLALLLLTGLVLNTLLFGFALWITANTAETPSLSEYAAALSATDNGFELPDALGRDLTKRGCWAMLLDGNGNVVWQHDKPAEVADKFTLSEVAGFTRWYLADYPVRVHTFDDGLLVIASPKDSVWKYEVSTAVSTFFFWPIWALIVLLSNFLLIFILSVVMTKRRYKVRDAARTEWIAAVSHDVRTPLSAVLGYAGQMEADETLTEKQRQEASVIRQKGEELRGLIADLNLTNRLMHSMEPIQQTWLSLAALIREAAAQLLNEQQNGRYEVEVEIAPRASQMQLYGDAALLLRMLKNLLSNSVRHNPEGCAITMALHTKGLGLCLTVSDNGCGYSKPQLKKLTGKTAPVTTGHGLGLTIVRQIAFAHGGRIRFSDNAHGGACCTVRFPGFSVRRFRTSRKMPGTEE